jgi:hypothetical protein
MNQVSRLLRLLDEGSIADARGYREVSSTNQAYVVSLNGLNNIENEAQIKAALDFFPNHFTVQDVYGDRTLVFEPKENITDETMDLILDFLDHTGRASIWCSDFLIEAEVEAQAKYIRTLFLSDDFLMGYWYAVGDFQSSSVFYEWMDDGDREFCYDGQTPTLSVDGMIQSDTVARLTAFIKSKGR